MQYIIHNSSFYHKTDNLVFNLEYIYEYNRTKYDIYFYLCRIVNNIDTYLDYNYNNYLYFDMENFNDTSCIQYNFKNNTNEKI